MAIEIIDGFQLNSSTPIDTRLVANGLNERNNILYKYEGLKVFDLSDGITYVWYNNQWQVDNSRNVSTSNTTTNYIPKLSGVNIITNSVIYEVGGNIGIGATAISSNEKLKVNGNIVVVGNGSKYIGDGSGLTNLNANNLIGNINVNNISNGATNSVLMSGTTQPTWLSQSQLSVGTASVAQNVYVINDTTSTTDMFISIVGNTQTNVNIKTNTTLRYKPSTQQLLLNNVGSNLKPTLSFFTSATTGIYRNNSENSLCFTIETHDTMKINTTGIKIINSLFSNIGSYLVGVGSEEETNKIIINAVNYDRIIYITTTPLDNNYYLSGDESWFQTNVYIGSEQIYSNFSDKQFGHKTFQQNYSFILPAGLIAYIKQSKQAVAWSDGDGPTILVKSLKFGL